MNRFIIGVDEAGRGPAIGPMVIASIAIPENDVQILRDLGTTDSKVLSKRKRREIEERVNFSSLKLNWKICIISISAESIDFSKPSRSLNDLGAEAFKQAIEGVSSESTVATVNMDPIGNKPDLFASRMAKEFLPHRPNLSFYSVAGMDSKCPVTSAASILAKEYRDREIEKLRDDLGFEIGSGYPSDPKTISAVDKLTNQHLPHESLRWTWKTTSEAWFRNHKCPIPVRSVEGVYPQQGLNSILWTEGRSES